MEKSCSAATLPEISTEIIKLNGSGCIRSAGDQLLIRKLFDWVNPQRKNSLSDFSNIQKLAVLFVDGKRTIEQIATPEMINLKHVWETLCHECAFINQTRTIKMAVDCLPGLGLMFYLVSLWCTIWQFNLLITWWVMVVSLAMGKQKFHTHYK